MKRPIDVVQSQPLNAMDRSMLEVNRALRQIGCPDFSTQALVWLSGSIDTVRLRAALARLSRRYPILTGRLVTPGRNGPNWKFHLGAVCPLREIALESPTPEAVFDCAAQLLSTPPDQTHADPIQFMLLHRPDGRDVLLMQYSHVLMDNSDAIPLLREIDRCSRMDLDESEGPTPPAPDLLTDYLRRYSRGRRLKAALRALDVRFRRLPSTPATLGREPSDNGTTRRFQIAARSLESVQVRAFERQVIRACGVPSLSMAILGSVFRAMEPLLPNRQGTEHRYIAGIGVDLGAPGIKRPIFQTLASVVPFEVRSRDLKDRNELMRTLNRRFRQELDGDADLGTIELADVFVKPGRFFRERFVRHSMKRLLQSGYSIWYAYFGSLDAIGASFCGASIDDVNYCASSWPLIGVTLLINRFRGRLLFRATYVPESVPASLVNQFLDAILEDLST